MGNSYFPSYMLFDYFVLRQNMGTMIGWPSKDQAPPTSVDYQFFGISLQERRERDL